MRTSGHAQDGTCEVRELTSTLLTMGAKNRTQLTAVLAAITMADESFCLMP